MESADKPIDIFVRKSRFYFVDYIVNGTDVSGFTTLVISVWAIAGILISLLGILGLYIGKIFDQVKARPTFIIKEKININ